MNYIFLKCLNKGKLENFGRPFELLNDEKTILYDLVYSLDKSESLKLAEMAKIAYNKNKNTEVLNKYDINKETDSNNENAQISQVYIGFINDENESFISKNQDT
jgi:hypothetical protein